MHLFNPSDKDNLHLSGEAETKALLLVSQARLHLSIESNISNLWFWVARLALKLPISLVVILFENILSGGCAGSLSLLVVQSIDYTRTRYTPGRPWSSGRLGMSVMPGRPTSGPKHLSFCTCILKRLIRAMVDVVESWDGEDGLRGKGGSSIVRAHKTKCDHL